MAEEKKGLFGRLLDFWRERTEEKSGGIGFWNREKEEQGRTAEKWQDALPQERAEKLTFSEETVRTAKGKKAEETEFFGQEKRKLFAEKKAEEEQEPALRTAEEERTQEKKTIVPIFTAAVFREKTERQEEKEKRKPIFLKETPLEEREPRKTVLVAAETKTVEKETAEEGTEEMPQETPKKEREQAKGAEIDIERLMREMTKRLWEERETSGRRLRR